MKLCILSFGNGNFDQGFEKVTLQISENTHPLPIKFVGSLPPAPEISEIYARWQSKFRAISCNFRLEAKETGVKNVSIDEIFNLGQVLEKRLNLWLSSESFRPVREGLFINLQVSENIRIIIETEETSLRRLPWHLWDFFERYRLAEVALSAPVYDRVTKAVINRSKPRILAILGSSYGIDLQTDRELLENLPGVETIFLVEPSRRELNEYLWDEQGWDIVFFAGHSSSHVDGVAGIISINKTETLTIPQLKKALKKAISLGLQLAIFNSCDGLGIAWELADLHIPQIIAMREPVPDLVAQEFLKYLIYRIYCSKSLYLAVREAREMLESLENIFPCATWLPVLCQNPAELSLSEEELWANIFTFNEDEKGLDETYSTTIAFIGASNVGISTYLASLVRWPNGDFFKSPVQTITPFNDDAEDLLLTAENILEQGLELAPTITTSHWPLYSFEIILKCWFSNQNIKNKSKSSYQLVRICLGCEEYVGISDLLRYLDDLEIWEHGKEAINKLLLTTEIMLLIDGTAHSKDADYANRLDKLLVEIKRLETTPLQRRIAVVFTKCELPELWLNRDNPRALASVRFPQVYRILESWQELGDGSIDYFTTSAFGMLGTQFLEPNSKILWQGEGGTSSVLKEPKFWKPFGLVSPIYWLCTGQRWKELDWA